MGIESFTDKLDETTQVDWNFSALIVDYSISMGDITGQLLGQIGCSCQYARNGVEAINLFSKGDFDLVVTDLHMPKMNGYQFVEDIAKISKSRKRLTRVLVTSSDSKRTTILSFLSMARRSGNTLHLGYVIKPWSSVQFFHQIRNLFCEFRSLCSKIDREIKGCVDEPPSYVGKNRLFLGVTEREGGVRIEVGSDYQVSVESETITDYLEQLEESMFFSPVDTFVFGVGQLDRRAPQSMVTLLLLIKGFADKHEKKIQFVDLGRDLREEIKKQGLNEVLGIYESGQNRAKSEGITTYVAGLGSATE